MLPVFGRQRCSSSSSKLSWNPIKLRTKHSVWNVAVNLRSEFSSGDSLQRQLVIRRFSLKYRGPEQTHEQSTSPETSPPSWPQQAGITFVLAPENHQPTTMMLWPKRSDKQHTASVSGSETLFPLQLGPTKTNWGQSQPETLQCRSDPGLPKPPTPLTVNRRSSARMRSSLLAAGI